jgi:hypothetical protein
VWVCALLLAPRSGLFSQDYIDSIKAESVSTRRSIEHQGSKGHSLPDTSKLNAISGILVTGTYRCKSIPAIAPVYVSLDPTTRVNTSFADAKRSYPLVVHGNIQYDFLYRSLVDTPYFQEDFRQHSVRTNVNILFRERYPMNLNFTLRYSNSPYFTNFFDVGFLYNRTDYERQAKARLLQQIDRSIFNNPYLKRLMDSANSIKNLLESISRPSMNVDPILKQIAEREQTYYQRMNRMDDTMQAGLPWNVDKAFKYDKFGRLIDVTHTDRQNDSESQLNSTSISRADSLRKELTSMNDRIRFLFDSIRTVVTQRKQQVITAPSVSELRKLPWIRQIDSSTYSRMDEVIGNIKSIGVGRTILNFSELTVSNVSLTGFSIEYNPKVYTAFAIGKVDYGLRDFMGRNTRSRGQELVMGRIGFGDITRKAVIVSVYTGRKFNYLHSFTDSSSNRIPVTGISIEGILKKNDFTYVVAEIAKSTIPMVGSSVQGKSIQSLLRVNDKSNVGLSMKAQALFPRSRTRVSGMIRRTGENFQSFSLLAYQTNQVNWNIKVDQPLLENRINLSGALRRNDFMNPFTEKSFKTSTVFKSLQVDVRIPKWPQVSVSYHPSAQLYIIDENRVREDAFYVVNASVVYPYQVGNTRMSTILIYNDFSSRGTDSGFFAYNGKSYQATQQVHLQWGSLNASYAYSDQAPFGYHTVDGGLDMTFKKIFSLSGTSSFYHVKKSDSYVGGRIMMGVDFGYFGQLHVQYEKSYLPTLAASLYPVENGRLTWTKIF